MKRAMRWLLSVVVVATATVMGVAAESRPIIDTGVSVRASGSTAPQAKGRYKKQSTGCVWDANDSGPNQCTPVTEGRFRKDGDSCVWDGNGRGPDQCTPKTGRFKKDGDKCVWNATDSGPNQCNPRQPK